MKDGFSDFGAPELPETPDENLGTDQDSKEGKKKRKKSALWRLPFVEVDDKPPAESGESNDEGPKGFDGWLAGLAIKSEGKGDKDAKPDKEKDEEKLAEAIKVAEPVEAGSTPTANEQTAEAVITDDGKELTVTTSAVQERLPDEDLESDELSLAEGIIRLHGPVRERVIPLAVAAVHESLPGDNRGEPIRWNQQLQQQQYQASETAPSAPEPVPGGGGEVPPIEPPGTAEAAADQPDPEHSSRRAGSAEEFSRIEPAEAYRQYLARQAAQVTAREGDAQQYSSATRKAVQDTRRAVRTGLNGVWAGLAALGVKERYRHKRHERKAEKRSTALQRRMDALYNRRDEALQEQIRQHATSSERLDVATRSMNQAAERYNEQNRRAEQAINRANEQTAQVQERLRVPPEHRLEKSAGGYIAEVDRTGKVVAAERSAIRYGHEFHHDQAIEAMAAQQRDAANGRAMFGAGNQNQGQGQAQQPFIPGSVPADLPNASMQGRPSGNRYPDDETSARTGSPAGAIWPWVIALLVVVIALIVVLV